MTLSARQILFTTDRLLVTSRMQGDSLNEQLAEILHPELLILDPPVGENRNPTYFSIFSKVVYIHIGICCLYNLGQYPGAQLSIEMGVRIFNPEYWGKGYGTELVKGLTYYAYGLLPELNHLILKTPIDNKRALRCYEKCGFVEYDRALVDNFLMVYMEYMGITAS